MAAAATEPMNVTVAKHDERLGALERWRTRLENKADRIEIWAICTLLGVLATLLCQLKRG